MVKEQGYVSMAGSSGGPLRLYLLGGLRALRDDVPVRSFVPVKAQALLAYLAATGRAHSREALADLFWGERPEAKARLSLQQGLRNLRGIVGPTLDTRRDSVILHRDDGVRVGVAAFLAHLAARTEDGTGAHLLAATQLYDGDFLVGFGPADAPAFDEWAATERARLRQLAVGALHTLGTASLAGLAVAR